MISISITLDTNGTICDIISQGHASQAQKGYDIVCAGISVLLQTYFCSTYSLDRQHTVLHDDGITFHVTLAGFIMNDLKKGLDLYLKTGLFLMRDTYPEYISLIIKEFSNGTS